MATPLRSPYEPAEEIPLDDSRYLLHDADTVYSANPRVGYRLSGFNANEEFNPAKGTPRQVMAREATEAAAKYLNEHGGFQPNVVGRDTTGSRNVSENPDLADYMVRNLYADPAVGFKNQSPALQQRVKDASEQAKLTMLFDQNNPVANQWRNLPERDYVNDPLPIPNRRPMSTGQALLNAIPRGVDVLQGDLFGAGHALARAVDKVPGFEGKNTNTLRIMEEGVKRNEEEAALNPAKYGSYKDVKGVGDVLPFMAEKAIESLPSRAPMAVGGLMGVGAKTVLGALSSGVAKKTAATIGATALGAVPHAGEIEQEQMKLKDPAPVWQVAGGALINSALDTFGVVKGLDQFLGASKAKGVLDVAKQLAQSLGVTSVTEGATEGLQQLTNIALRSMHDPDYNPLTNPKDRASAMQELAEAGIGGAAAGGLMGGLGRASGMVRQSLVDQPTTENRANELPQSNSEQNPIQDPTGDEAITAPPLATETNAQSGLSEMPATPPPTVDAVGGEVAPGVDDLWAEAQQLDARAGDQQSEASLDKYFQEVNESYPDASEALKQRMASSLRIIEESNDTDSDEYKQAVNALNQATNELDKNAPEINPIDYANSKGDDYKLGLIHLYNESLKTLAYNRSRVQRVTDSGTPLSDDALADIEESNRNAEDAIANVQSQFTPEELETRHVKYRDDLWNSLSKSSLSGQDRDQISEVNEKFVESLKGKSPDQLKRIAQEKRRRADNTIGLNGGRHNRLSGAQLSEAMYAERLADELNTTSTAPVVSTDSVQGLAPDAADNGVGEEDVDTAPDKPFGELFGSHPLVINQRDKDGGRLSRVINKDIEKAERANKFIGFGSPGSSTDVYRQAAESLGAANIGDYTEDDQVFVSVNGNRNGAIAVTDPRYQAELDSAARAGVMFVTDTKEYTDGSRFNTGEKALRTELEKRGYVDQGNGEWIPGNGWMEWANSLSVTSTPDATGNLGNVTERDKAAGSELSAESSVKGKPLYPSSDDLVFARNESRLVEHRHDEEILTRDPDKASKELTPVEEILREIDQLGLDLPELRFHLIQDSPIVKDADGKVIKGHSLKGFSSTHPETGVGHIALNSSLLKDTKNGLTAREKIGYILSHELGHALDRKLGGISNSPVWQPGGEIYEALTEVARRIGKDKTLSRGTRNVATHMLRDLSKNNGLEMFADALTLYVNNRGVLGNELETKLRQEFKILDRVRGDEAASIQAGRGGSGDLGVSGRAVGGDASGTDVGAKKSNTQGTIVDGEITLGQASTSSVSAEQQGNKETPISAKLANIPITADGQQIPGTGQHVDRPTNQDKLSVEAASIDKVLESAKKSGRLDASDLAAVFDSHPQLLKNFHNFLQRTEPGTKPGYTKNGTPIYEKPFNVLKVLREAAKGNPEAAKVLTKMHEELKGFSAEIQALKDFADNAPMLGKSREMTDESERSDDEGADNAIGDLTIDNRYGTQNARVFDPNESTGVIYHGARTSNESLGKVRGYVADSLAIFPRLRSVSGLPEVIPDGKGNYVAGREGQTADEVRKQNKYFELVKTGDYWHVHEVTKDDVGESIAPNVIREKVRNAITNVSGNASTGKSGTAQNAKLSLTRMTPLKRKIKGEVKETSDVFIDATHLTRLGATLNRQDASKSPSLKDYFDNFATAVAVLYDQNIFADDGFTVSSIPHDLVIAYDRTVVNGVEKSTPVTYGEAFAAQRESDYTWDKYGDGAYAMFMDSPYRGATSVYDEQTGETLKVVGEEYSPDMQQDGVEREDIKASMKERDKALRQEVAQKETTEPTATYFEPSGKSYVEDGRLSKFVHDIAAKLGIKAKFHVVDESGVTGLLAHLNALQANLMDTMDLKQDVLDEVRHMRNVVLDTIGGKSMAHFRQELEQEAAHTNPGVQALAEALKFVSNKDLATEENAEKVYSILGKFEKDYRVSHAQLKDRLLALRATMKALREAKSSKIIYNDTSPIAIEREPIIFISNLDVRGKPKKLARQINEAAHELGHLIKRVAVDQLIEKAKRGDTEADAVVKAIFGSVDWNNESEALLADERFAEMTRKWSLTHAVPKNAVDRFFKDIGNVMRKLYNFAKSMFTKAEDRSQFESFEQFMEAMLDRSGIVRSNMESAQKEVALAQRDNSRGYNGNLGPNERWAKDAADARFANATKRAVAPTWEAANLHKANTYVTGTAKTYADFVNDLVLSEFAPQNKKGVKSHNYTPQESLDDVQKYAKRAATWSKDKPVLGTVTKTLGGIADIMKLVAPHVRAVVPVMQDIAPHWGEIGGHWVTLPGTKPLTKMWRVRIENGKITKESRDFVPIHIEIGKIRNGILKDNKSLVEIMSDVLAALPKVEGLAWMKSAQRKQVAERYEGMARDLLKFTTNQIPYSALSEEAKAVADYFKLLNDVFARSSEYSVTFNKRDAYFPLRIDKDKWNQNSRPVIEALIKYGKYPVEAAEHLFNEIARSHGIVDESLVDEAILASGLTAKHGRKFPLELQKALLDLDVYSMDIHHIVQGYTHQIIKRAVEQSRFGDYKRDTKGTYIKDDNGHFIFDPMGQINHIMDVDRATYYQNNSKGVHPEKLDWLRTKAFPALRGTLGGTIDPKLNALMDWTMLALNFIMLPLSVTSQLPDLAGIANMRGRTLLQPREMLRDVIKVARYFTDKSERESLRRAAQVIGSIEPHLVSSILAESMADEYMTPSTKRLSEAFFEATQMKRFTDFSRVLSTRFAIDALNEYADKPTAAKTLKLLQELHLSPQALAAWDRAGRPTDVNSLMQHDQIRTALAQWNDMAILRPSAGMRPVIGSDVRAKLFWHLKNYLYAFYYMQMKRAWVNMKDESNFAAAVPAISLGAFAMGLALAGYELRKLLANEIIPELVGVDGKSKDEDAGDLVWESFDRSGLMGPFSIIHDMWSAEKRGQMAISSLMGPAFSKTVDFMDKDLPDFLAANIPVVAQSTPLRSAARRELGKYLPDQLIGED